MKDTHIFLKRFSTFSWLFIIGTARPLKTPSMTYISKAYFASSFYPRSPVIGIYLLYCKTGSRYWFTSGGAPVVTQSGVKMWSPWNQMRRDQKIETSQQISNKTSPSRARAKTEAKTKAKAKPTVKTLSTAVRCTSVCGECECGRY